MRKDGYKLDHELGRKGTLAGFFGNVMKDLTERFGAWVWWSFACIMTIIEVPGSTLRITLNEGCGRTRVAAGRGMNTFLDREGQGDGRYV